MEKTVNYVIAAWSGPRRGKPRPTRKYKQYFGDRSSYLKFHITKVLELRKHISHITIVAPFNYESEPKEFTAYLDSFPEDFEGIKTTVLRRDNMGLSFGSFSYAFEKLGEDWEYYIFNEDDHIPVAQDFDAKLIKKLKDAGPQCGAVCAFLRKDRKKSKADEGRYENDYSKNPVIGHPLSVSKASVLSKVASVNGGKLPYKFDVYSGLTADEFSYGFPKAGYRLEDMTDKFCGAFAKGNGAIKWFNGQVGLTGARDKDKEPIVVPIELWEMQNRALLQSLKTT